MGWNFRKKKDTPGGLWTKCPSCSAMLQARTLQKNVSVCSDCGHHFRMGSAQRVAAHIDEGTFQEFGAELLPGDPLEFDGYSGTLKRSRDRSGRNEAALVGTGKLDGIDLVFGCFDFSFVGGSMGVVVGERITMGAEHALDNELPYIVVSTSGGARMQEGALSLMQMAKTSAAIARMGEAGLPYISVLADPCTGGVIASFAALGDVIIAEPKALIGFAGPRVIQTTIGTQLPEGFQRSEFLLERGFIDRVVARTDLKAELAAILRFTMGKRLPPEPIGAKAPEQSSDE
ncbi:MAG: acetyl-CoA carboxylase, carboxyltransferase subunit beta [Planctomycetota bacterium]